MLTGVSTVTNVSASILFSFRQELIDRIIKQIVNAFKFFHRSRIY